MTPNIVVITYGLDAKFLHFCPYPSMAKFLFKNLWIPIVIKVSTKSNGFIRHIRRIRHTNIFGANTRIVSHSVIMYIIALVCGLHVSKVTQEIVQILQLVAVQCECVCGNNVTCVTVICVAYVRALTVVSVVTEQTGVSARPRHGLRPSRTHSRVRTVLETSDTYLHSVVVQQVAAFLWTSNEQATIDPLYPHLP